MTIRNPFALIPIPATAKAGAVGGVVMTLAVRAQYDQLFVFSPLAASILDEPLPLLVSSFFVGSVLMGLLSRRSNEQLGTYDALALAASVAFLPAIVVFAYTVRVGIVTGFGPTVSVESFGHFVVGMFFVMFYGGFGAALAAVFFVGTFVGCVVGAFLSVAGLRRFTDRP